MWQKIFAISEEYCRIDKMYKENETSEKEALPIIRHNFTFV